MRVSQRASRGRCALTLLLVGLAMWPGRSVRAGSPHPYYSRRLPEPQDVSAFQSDGYHIDLTNAHLPPYPGRNFLGNFVDLRGDANAGFDARAASAIMDSVQPKIIFARQSSLATPFLPGGAADRSKMASDFRDSLLEEKDIDIPLASFQIKYYTLRSTSLAMMAHGDFFPGDPAVLAGPILPDVAPSGWKTFDSARGRAGERLSDYFRDMVNSAILSALPGYCGTYDQGVDAATDLLGHIPEGNYDMTEMHLVPLAYRYYDLLTPEAREHLITQLLGQGHIHRVREDDLVTSGGVPDDWSRAGFISPLGMHKDLDETENHILAILVGRYLTNQLLYQRDHDPAYDNRRNGGDGRPNCTDLVLSLLRNILRDDFSEYNAKNYQEETRWPLVNLCTYAYDEEVRLAARMVLDYISAHIAVSSNDLRRMVPFRRRNEGKNVSQNGGFMTVGLLDGVLGPDPMAPYFAMQAGNVRAFATPNTQQLPGADPGLQIRPWTWGIAVDGQDVTKEVLGDYRLPPSIHDLFVNDQHRRFFQRLHRTPRDEEGGNRNCDNMEIYAGSPSYLITAGGAPATYAIDPHFAGIVVGDQDQQLGVALPTSFMPTGESAGPGTQNSASDLIQFSRFSQGVFLDTTLNYGVAPDFACGYGVHLPPWVTASADPPFTGAPGVHFVNKRGSGRQPAGFYLAIYQDGDFGLLEAFDTWMHADVSFEEFKRSVLARNPGVDTGHPAFGSKPEWAGVYHTQNGNHIHFGVSGHENFHTSVVSAVEYGSVDQADGLGDAGNVTAPFLNGTILNSPGEAVVTVSNPVLGTTLTLDLSDRWHPRRTSENGVVETAGSNHEVWLDTEWTGAHDGDFFHPFGTLAAAANAVALGGVVKITPGPRAESGSVHIQKAMRLIAPIGGAQLGDR